MSCLVLCRTWDWPQAQVLSHRFHPLLLFFRRSHLRTSPMILDPCISCDVPRQSGGSAQIPFLTGDEPKSVENRTFDTEAIEPEDLEPRRIELDRNLGTDPYQKQERFMRNCIIEDMDEFGKVGAEMSYFQSQMHSDYDSAESIADSDLEDGELRKKAGFTAENAKSRRLWIFSNTNCFGETCCIVCVKKQRDRKPIQEFCFQKNVDPSNLGRSLLEGSGKIWNCEARTPSWISQWLYQWVSATNLCSKIGTTGRSTRISWISTKTSSSTRRIIDEGKGSPRYSNPKYARTGRNEKSSRTTSWWGLSAKIQRKSWDNTKAHFSVARNARTDEFYEWLRKFANYSGRLSYVSSQPAMIPSSRSMLSCDKRLPLDTWNTSGLQGNVFGNQCSTFYSLWDHPQRIQCGAPQRERESVPRATGLETLFARDDKTK